jgi:hypothetical protein
MSWSLPADRLEPGERGLPVMEDEVFAGVFEGVDESVMCR